MQWWHHMLAVWLIFNMVVLAVILSHGDQQ